MPDAPETSAAQAGLDYVDTGVDPGFTRRRCGRGFCYLDARGDVIRGPRRARIEALAIPPAWREVWICPHEHGHILATGRDERGRKQYIYHPRWNAVRQEARYHGLVDFAEALPRVRERVARDLRGAPTALSTVLAASLRLVDTTLLRVGSEAYAREHGSRGLTTLEKEHVHISVNGSLVLEFPGKHGVEQSLEITDPEVARLIHDRLDDGSDRLLSWDDGGQLRPISPAQLNAWLAEISGLDVTIKTFRTWGGTVTATRVLLARGPCPDDERGRTRALAQSLDAVAERLGNTRAVCREHYVHPGVIDAYAAGSLRALTRRSSRLPGLSRDERITLGVCRALRDGD
ncbi:MAG: DNA topoisomerase IB [Deltaproteobacteria bacterium]|nr:DNA topoisomerase IB [Deltaproteobacteria bacterium]